MDNSFSTNHIKCIKAVNEALNNVSDFKDTMQDIVEVLFAIYECDRAYLIYPCTPDALQWRAIECATDKWFSANDVGQDMMMDESVASVCKTLHEKKDVVTFGVKGDVPVPKMLIETFKINSQISMPIYSPKGDALALGLHQCSYERVWSDEDKNLFREVGLLITKFISESYDNFKHYYDQVGIS